MYRVEIKYAGDELTTTEQHEHAEVVPIGLHIRNGLTETWIPAHRFDVVSITAVNDEGDPVKVVEPERIGRRPRPVRERAM
jgi:hypothetical protein